MIRSLALVAIVALALTACGSDPAPAQQDGDNRGAEGEVQGGTISDAMIPLDTLTSQSPPMKQRPAAGGEGAGKSAIEVAPADETTQSVAAPAGPEDVTPSEEPAREAPADE